MPFGFVGLDGHNESCIRWGPDTPLEGAILGKGAPIIKYRYFLPWAVQKDWTYPIEMPFGMLSRVDPRNHVLNGDTNPREKGQFLGKGVPRHARRHSDVNCAKTAEPIEMPFGLWTRVSTKRHKFNRIRKVAPTYRIRLNRPSATAIQPYRIVSALWAQAVASMPTSMYVI